MPRLFCTRGSSIPVDFPEFLIHLLNFFAPPWAVAALAAGLAKLFWRRLLRTVSWWQLARLAALVGSATWLACLVAQGRDGKMSSYALLVLSIALALWWRGFFTPGARSKG